ncbi:TPA: hypothetical protein DCW54_03350 [Candidatus Dependentiae bacterium]|nr:hypothetical protein [Candidatus Dependentiae bacterium]
MKRVYIALAALITISTGLSANMLTDSVKTTGKNIATTMSKSAHWYWEHKMVTIPATALVAAAALYTAKKAGLCAKIKALKNRAK